LPSLLFLFSHTLLPPVPPSLLFFQEFRTYNPQYYASSIQAGTITVNGEKVLPSYLLKNNDLILHKCHRHEPPVVGEKVRIGGRRGKEGGRKIV